MRKQTIRWNILKTLRKCKKPVSWRMVSGWYPNYFCSSVYMTIHNLKREGLVREEYGRFLITEEGIKKFQEASQHNKQGGE